jgi:hypothetical protein
MSEKSNYEKWMEIEASKSSEEPYSYFDLFPVNKFKNNRDNIKYKGMNKLNIIIRYKDVDIHNCDHLIDTDINGNLIIEDDIERCKIYI